MCATSMIIKTMIFYIILLLLLYLLVNYLKLKLHSLMETVAEPGFFGMLDLSFRVWVPVETYGEMILASNYEFLAKNFCD